MIFAIGPIVKQHLNRARHPGIKLRRRPDEQPRRLRRTSGYPNIPAILDIGSLREENENACEPVLIGPVRYAEIVHAPAFRRGGTNAAWNDSSQDERWSLALLGRHCRPGEQHERESDDAS